MKIGGWDEYLHQTLGGNKVLRPIKNGPDAIGLEVVRLLDFGLAVGKFWKQESIDFILISLQKRQGNLRLPL